MVQKYGISDLNLLELKKKALRPLQCTKFLCLYLAKQTTSLITILIIFKNHEILFQKRRQAFPGMSQQSYCVPMHSTVFFFFFESTVYFCREVQHVQKPCGRMNYLRTSRVLQGERQVEPCRPRSGLGMKGMWAYYI